MYVMAASGLVQYDYKQWTNDPRYDYSVSKDPALDSSISEP